MLRHICPASRRSSSRGFTLVELAIVLGVSSLLLTGLWRLMSAGTTRSRDQVVSEQHRKLVTAVQSYLTTGEGQTKLAALAPTGGYDTLPVPTATWDTIANCKANAAMAAYQTFCEYLPQGFNATTTNPYNQTYIIRIRKEDDTAVGIIPKNYSFAVMTRGGQTIPDTSGSRIASLIGRDGGFVYSESVCGAATNLCGSYGTWSLNPNSSYGENMASGRVGSVSYRFGNIAEDSFWLARKNIPGDTAVAGGIDDLNTVQTNISLGGNTLYGGPDTGEYAGAVSNLLYLQVGRSTATGTVLKVMGDSCRKTGPSDVNCDYLLDVQGDAAVSGLLSANKLYAGQFIYDTTSSDRRLKREIAPLTGAADKLSQLNGYSFFMKDTGEKKYGVIAQEVEKAYPEIVHDDVDGMKSVDYIGLIGPLVAAVRDLKEENAALRADLEALKAKMAPKTKKPAR